MRGKHLIPITGLFLVPVTACWAGQLDLQHREGPATLLWSFRCVSELCFGEDVLRRRWDGQELVSFARGLPWGKGAPGGRYRVPGCTVGRCGFSLRTQPALRLPWVIRSPSLDLGVDLV